MATDASKNQHRMQANLATVESLDVEEANDVDYWQAEMLLFFEMMACMPMCMPCMHLCTMVGVYSIYDNAQCIDCSGLYSTVLLYHENPKLYFSRPHPGPVTVEKMRRGSSYR